MSAAMLPHPHQAGLSRGRSLADPTAGGTTPAYAPFPASFRMPTHDAIDPSQTLVNIINPTPLTPMESSQALLDYTPTADRPNSVFPLGVHDALSSSASPLSSFDLHGQSSINLGSELSLSDPSFNLADFDADLFQRLVAGTDQGQLPTGGNAFSSYGTNSGGDSTSFLDLASLQSSMDMDSHGINPFEFDPSFAGGFTSDSEGYASSTVSTDASSMRMGPYFSSRKRPSEDASVAPGHPPQAGLSSKALKKKSRSTRSSSKPSSSKQADPTTFGSLNHLSPLSLSSHGGHVTKRRKSFNVGSGEGSSSASPPSPTSVQQPPMSSMLYGHGQGLLSDSPPSKDGPLRRTNSNPHPASFASAQPLQGQNSFFPPRSTSNSPAQPINKHLPLQTPQHPHHGYRSQSASSTSSFVTPASASASSSSLAAPHRSRQNSSAASSSAQSTTTSHTSPSSVTSSSNAGLGPVVETSLEWVPSKPRIRKSIRRRLEKKRDEPQRMTHVLDGRPPPPVEVKVSSAASSSKTKAKGKKTVRETMGVSAAKDSATESSRPKKNRPLHPPAAGTPAVGVRRKNGRASSVSSVEVPATPARPSSASSAAKGKERAVDGGRRSSAAGSAVESDLSGGEDSEEEDEGPEEKMERMLRDFKHLGTELPPRVFEGGVSPLMPERKKGKIPGSAMDRLPVIDSRFDALEQGIQSYIKAVARRSFQNSMLPGLDFPTSDVQSVWVSLDGQGDFVPRPVYRSPYEEGDADDESM